MFGFQSIINMGVNLQLMPAKGMTLPFISYGGSSLIAIAISMGMVLALTRKRPEKRTQIGLTRMPQRAVPAEYMAKGTILLAAGGTGGHLFPAEALAHELIARGWTVHLATDDRAERFAGQFPGRGRASDRLGDVRLAQSRWRWPRAFWTIWRGVRQASALIRRIKPAAVVGFGGYPTLPPLYAATRRKVPTLIHEQNAVMGRANKALAARVDAIAGGFLRSRHRQCRRQDRRHRQSGPAGRAGGGRRRPIAPSQAGEPFRLLVFGGSQGAQFFSDAVPAAIALLPDEQRRRLADHAAGARRRRRRRSRAAYRGARRRGRGLAVLHRHGARAWRPRIW